MSEPKWTPWRIAPFCNDRLAGLKFVEADWGPEREDGTYDSNIIVTVSDYDHASLIGAAPDLYRQLEDARVTLEEVAKILARDWPSVANNIVNQCAIRCGDVLAKARGEAP